MKELGELLKQKRIEAGLSIEEVCKETRLTLKHIKAIEEGNIEFFRDDLSYLRFFVRSYCDVVGADFEVAKEMLRKGIDDYTETKVMSTIKEHEKVEKNVSRSEKLTKVKKNNSDEVVRHKVKNIRKRVDFSFVSLIAIIVVIIVVVGGALSLYMKTERKQPTDKGNVAIAQKENQDKVEDKKDKNDKKPVEDKKEIEITKTGIAQYTIENIKDGEALAFEVFFGGSSSGFSVNVDGVTLAEPQSRIYQWKESTKANITAKQGMKITFYVGFFNNTQFKVNGVNVKIDDSIINSNNSQNIEFTIMGDEE